MMAKREMESQALKPEGKGLPLEAAKATRRNPAGMRRKDETKKGPYLGSTSFIATMAVPQKKNGDINTAPSHNPSAKHSLFDDDDSFFFDIPSSSSSSSVVRRHSTSCPVPTQSRNSVSVDDCVDFPVVLFLEHGTLNRREDGVVEKREEEGSWLMCNN
jgi:hypothetical protein